MSLLTDIVFNKMVIIAGLILVLFFSGALSFITSSPILLLFVFMFIAVAYWGRK